MKIQKNKDQDFINASLLAKMPIEIIMAVIATIIFIFGVGFLLKLENQAQPQTVNLAMFYIIAMVVIGIITIPFIISPIATYLTLITGSTDIDVNESIKLTFRLQFSMIRQIGNSTNAQGRIAVLNNIRRLSSFVWVKRYSHELIVVVRQDLRADVNNMVDDEALIKIADDIASITNKTYTGYTSKTINDKMIFNHYKRYKVAVLS